MKIVFGLWILSVASWLFWVIRFFVIAKTTDPFNDKRFKCLIGMIISVGLILIFGKILVFLS